MNSVVIIGRLSKDPELKYIPGTGTAVASCSIAVSRDYTKKDGTKETDFIPFEVMGKSAEYMANYLNKGRLVAIQGSIRVDRYKDQAGQDKTFTKIAVKNIQSLESSKTKEAKENGTFEPSFEPPQGLDPQGFQAIDDDDIPF